MVQAEFLLFTTVMKPFVEKLPLSESESFVAETHRTPLFEVAWHQHVEYELILFTEGEGAAYVGNYVGAFKTGDVFFLGSNLPHTFQKIDKELVTSAVVVQFKKEFWGEGLLALPESRRIADLFERAANGLRIHDSLKRELAPKIRAMEHAVRFKRISLLLECIDLIAESTSYTMLSTQDTTQFVRHEKNRIDKVFQYTFDRFMEPITLTQVARLAEMSAPAFCSYFKRTTKKRYIDFLNEVRVGHACRMLMDSQKTVESIAYESGYNTVTHFNRQFMRVKNNTPSAYRKIFRNREEMQALG